MRALDEASRMRREESPPLKVFKPKNLNIPILERYPTGVDLGENYWSSWRCNPYRAEKGSLMDHTQIARIADEVGYERAAKVEKIISTLRDGADLGIEGEGRWPSEGVNDPSVEVYGARIGDALQTGIDIGYMYGPIHPDEMPLEDIKVSPMTVRLKPNGSGRIIINLSWPRSDWELGDGWVLSPNQGMKNWVEFEQCTMTTDRFFRVALYRNGRKCWISKADWDYAFKHCSVRPEDHPFMVVSFGGRYFVEKCLTFGGVNSPSIFRMCASFLIEITELETGKDPRDNVMQLDDNCTVGMEGDQQMLDYYATYRRRAKEMNISLASTADKSKAFEPTHEGEVLGLFYNTVDWTWWIPKDKSTRMIILMCEAVREGKVSLEGLMKITGKVSYYGKLVHGKFERGFLFKAMVQGSYGRRMQKKDKMIELKTEVKVQLIWWILNLRALALVRQEILDPIEHFRLDSLVLFSDAAGGTPVMR